MFPRNHVAAPAYPPSGGDSALDNAYVRLTFKTAEALRASADALVQRGYTVRQLALALETRAPWFYVAALVAHAGLGDRLLRVEFDAPDESPDLVRQGGAT